MGSNILRSFAKITLPTRMRCTELFICDPTTDGIDHVVIEIMVVWNKFCVTTKRKDLVKSVLSIRMLCREWIKLPPRWLVTVATKSVSTSWVEKFARWQSCGAIDDSHKNATEVKRLFTFSWSNSYIRLSSAIRSCEYSIRVL